MEKDQLYQATIDKWGVEAQYEQMVEECAELITALKHFQRDKADKQTVINELADVTLMIGQLTWMFGSQQVEDAIQEKLVKLDKLLLPAPASPKQSEEA